MHRIRSAAPIAQVVLLLGLSLVSARSVGAHEPPPILFEWTLEEEQLTWKILAMSSLSDEWIRIPRRERDALAPGEQPAARRIVQEHFKAQSMVRIDGIEVSPHLENVEIVDIPLHDGGKISYLVIELTFGCKGRPRQIALTWRRFDLFRSYPLFEISGVLAWGKRDFYIALNEDEPEYIWHAPLETKEPARAPPPLPPAPARTTVALPLLSLLVLAAGLAAWALARRRTSRALRWSLAVGSVALAAGLSGFARYELPLPGGTGFVMPTEEQARDIFEALHRNIYRAFDYESEEQIYDTLARSVEGPLLDKIYTEVYEGLILRDEGGAVCRIRKVDLLDVQVQLPAEPGARTFSVRCRWRVNGRVGHWGHEHLRKNEYQALYTVRHGEEGWRIAAVQILQQKRIPI